MTKVQNINLASLPHRDASLTKNWAKSANAKNHRKCSV